MAEKEVTVTPESETKKQKQKMIWTMEKCKQSSKRFTTREEWQHGAPSSFKAAVARGWDADCCAHMTNLKAMKATKAAPAAKSKAKVGAPRKSA